MNRKSGSGCRSSIGEILFPIILFVIIGIALFYATDTPIPTPSFASGLASRQPAGQRQPGLISPIYTSGVQAWAEDIVRWEKEYGIDREILATIMQVESCGIVTARSHAGAASLFQVMPIHFEYGENKYDPDTNAKRAAEFFWDMHEYTGYNVYQTFAGYHGGFAAAKTTYENWGPKTKQYYEFTSAIYDDAKAGLSESPTIENILVAKKSCPP